MASSIIILFTSGAYSDYGLLGLRSIDEDEYLQAKKQYDKIEQKVEEAHKNIKKLDKENNTSRNELQRLALEAEAHAKTKSDVWENLRKKGVPVVFTEFHLSYY